MNILWVTALNETEVDIIETFKRMRGHWLHILCPSPKNDYFFNIDIPDEYITYSDSFQHLVKNFNDLVKLHNFDLVIKRAGWGTEKAPMMVPDLARQHKIPCAIWCAEQGEQREWQFEIAKHYDIILVNNKMDSEYYRVLLPNSKKILYFPFGCVPATQKRVRPVPEYKCDVVVYGNPLYDFYKSKRICIDNMVIPLLFDDRFKIDIWGLKTWLKVPNIETSGRYRGKYPYQDLDKVNSSCKIMMGLSANIMHGGYGSKLIRAMSSKTFVMWHDTVGMPEEFTNRHHLVSTNSAKKTVSLVKYYLNNRKERMRIAREGQKLAHKEYDYKILFRRLFANLQTLGVLK